MINAIWVIFRVEKTREKHPHWVVLFTGIRGENPIWRKPT
jgi:hypothetical protein